MNVSIKVSLKLSVSVFCCLVSVCFTVSCASHAHIAIHDTADYELAASFTPSSLLEKNVTRILNRKNGQKATASVFDTDELKKTLVQSGVKVSGLTVHGAMGLNLSGTVPTSHAFVKDVIIYNKSARNIRVCISKESITAFLHALPKDSRDFIDMLMAPLFTGETMTTAEYEQLIGSAYGNKIASELHNAVFSLTLDVPYQVQTAHIHPIGEVTVQTRAQNISRVLITISLIELLCTTDAITVQL